MSKRDRNPTANLWDDLDNRKLLELLHKILPTRERSLLRFDNVVSVGVGYRTKTGQLSPTVQRAGKTLARRSVQDEVCLRFVVSKKTKRPPKNPVPRRVVVFVTHRGRRRRCEIPTDVDPIGKGDIQQGGEPNGVITQIIPGTSLPKPWPEPATGAICCRVIDKFSPKDDYFLGCHHTFTLSSHTGDWRPAPNVGVYRGGDTWSLLGLTIRWTELIAGRGRPGIDAALAKSTNDDSLPAWVLNNPPKHVGTGVFPPDHVVIHTPRGVDIKATFAGLYERRLFKYGDRDILIGPVYEFVIPKRDVETVGGDSGSRIMDVDGDTLWGMHFYGVRDSGGYRTYAVPAYVLFANGRFDGLTIDLPRASHA